MTRAMVSLVTVKEVVARGGVTATPVPMPEVMRAIVLSSVRMAMFVVRLVKVGIAMEVMKTVTHVSPLEQVER